MKSEPVTAGPRLATAAETLLVGVLVSVASVPVVTALAAAGAGATVLAEFTESGTPVRVRRFVTLLRRALGDPWAWAVPPLLAVGPGAGRARRSPADFRVASSWDRPWCSPAADAGCLRCRRGYQWRPGDRWSRVLADSARTRRTDPAGTVLMLGALAVVTLVVSSEPAFAVIAPGLVLLAAVAVHRREDGRCG